MKLLKMISGLSASLCLVVPAMAVEPVPAASNTPIPAISTPITEAACQAPCVASQDCCCEGRRMFASDRCFEGFIGPITNPVLAKDPRS